MYRARSHGTTTGCSRNNVLECQTSFFPPHKILLKDSQQLRQALFIVIIQPQIPECLKVTVRALIQPMAGEGGPAHSLHSSFWLCDAGSLPHVHISRMSRLRPSSYGSWLVPGFYHPLAALPISSHLHFQSWLVKLPLTSMFSSLRSLTQYSIR